MSIVFDHIFEREARKGSGDLMSTLLRAHHEAPETTEAFDIGYADGKRTDVLDERDAETRLVDDLGSYGAVANYLGVRRMFNPDGGVTDEATFALAQYAKGFAKAVYDREVSDAKAP